MKKTKLLTKEHKQYVLGFVAGKKKARIEIIIISVCLYFLVSLIGYIANF